LLFARIVYDRLSSRRKTMKPGKEEGRDGGRRKRRRGAADEKE
jgi:hypothetical protein